MAGSASADVTRRRTQRSAWEMPVWVCLRVFTRVFVCVCAAALLSWAHTLSLMGAAAQPAAPAAQPPPAVPWSSASTARCVSPSDVWSMREGVREMLTHAWDAYMRVGYVNGDVRGEEVKPLSCAPRTARARERGTLDDPHAGAALTLIDALPALALAGEARRFRCAVSVVLRDVSASRLEDVGVSVFELSIRVLGALVSSHILSTHRETRDALWPPDVRPVDDPAAHSHPTHRFVSLSEWGCDASCPCAASSCCAPLYSGQLLTLAAAMADTIMAAFDTQTGIPVHRVNARTGRRDDTARETCTAAAGTFMLELGALSALTGNASYVQAARRANDALWMRRTRTTNLVGSALDAETGQWRMPHTGIGAGVDSFWEYLLKAAVAFDDEDLATRWDAAADAVHTYMDMAGVHVEVGITDGKPLPRPPYISSLQAFYPGLEVLAGRVAAAQRHYVPLASLWRKYTALPEIYDATAAAPVPFAKDAPLRPELLESTYYLYAATQDPAYLFNAWHMIRAINMTSRTPCGFASVADVATRRLDDRMDSYVLAETFRYAFAMFDHALWHWPVRLPATEGRDLTAAELPVRYAVHPLAHRRAGSVHLRSSNAVLPSSATCAGLPLEHVDDIARDVPCTAAMDPEECRRLIRASRGRCLELASLPLREDGVVLTTEGHPLFLDTLQAPPRVAMATEHALSASAGRVCHVRELRGTPADPGARQASLAPPTCHLPEEHTSSEPVWLMPQATDALLLGSLPPFDDTIAPQVHMAVAHAVANNGGSTAEAVATRPGATSAPDAAPNLAFASTIASAIRRAFDHALGARRAPSSTPSPSPPRKRPSERHAPLPQTEWATPPQNASSTRNATVPVDGSAGVEAFVQFDGQVQLDEPRREASAAELLAALQAASSQSETAADSDTLSRLSAAVPQLANTAFTGDVSSIVALADTSRGGFVVGNWSATAVFEPARLLAALRDNAHLAAHVDGLGFFCRVPGGPCHASIAAREPSPMVSLHLHVPQHLATAPPMSSTSPRGVIRLHDAASSFCGKHASQPTSPAYDLHIPAAPASFGVDVAGLALSSLPLLVASPADACGSSVSFAFREQVPGDAFIAVVLRGGCTFVEKVRQAQRVGAAAAVVLDISGPGSGPDDVPLSQMADDGTGSDILIPSVFIAAEAARYVWASTHAVLQSAAAASSEYVRMCMHALSPHDAGYRSALEVLEAAVQDATRPEIEQAQREQVCNALASRPDASRAAQAGSLQAGIAAVINRVFDPATASQPPRDSSHAHDDAPP